MSRLLAASCLILSGAALARAQEPAPDYGRLLAAVHSEQSARAVDYAMPGSNFHLDSAAAYRHWEYESWCFQLDADKQGPASYDPCVRYRIAPPVVWQRADFDQDGRPDLLLTDRWTRAVCLLNRGRELPEVVPLEFRKKSDQGVNEFQVITVGSRVAVVHLRIAPRSDFDRQRQTEPEVWHDTLVYHAGAFVEYNPHPGQQWPPRLDLVYSDYVEGSYRVEADLQTGQATARAARDGNHQLAGPLRFRLTPDQLNQLRQHAAYLDPARLRALYDTQYAPRDTAWLTLHYPGRPVVRVADYGTFGTHSLGQLYGVLGEAYWQAYEEAVEEQKRQFRQLPPFPAWLPRKQ